jgi:hypothetical protein
MKAKLDEKLKSRTEDPKKFLEYRQSKPFQLSLFNLLENEKEFSHTIELYDFMPKYVWGKVERVGGVFLPRLEREFECRNKKYYLTLFPASIEDDKGNEKYHYPGKREEIVEDALRKIMADGQGIFLDAEAGVSFTLYRLQKELQDNGHSYSRQQLKDSLEVLAKTNIELKSESGKVEFIFHPIEAIGFNGENEETQTFVKFSPLITKSLKERSFRLFNYKKVMSYKTVIARQLHKRMAHHYTQASLTDPYTIMLTTVIRDFGLTRRKQLKDNLREAEESLNELKEKNVVINFYVNKVIEKSPRIKIIDAKINIQPHPEFVTEAKRANARKKIETGNTNEIIAKN